MSLPLPVLDDRTWADLVAEMRALIPSLCSEWTDHNPADPGITMVELFAWLTEMLLYRADRVSDETVRVFLRLLNGPDWTQTRELDEEIRATVLGIRQPYRAVTARDYETLAQAADAGVARTRCVPRRNLAAFTPGEREEPRPGWISLIVVPREGATAPFSLPGAPRATADLLARVAEDLAPRRLLTVRQTVVSPFYAPVAPEIVLARRPDVLPEAVRNDVAAALEGWLDPRRGGPTGDGWPFGRAVFVSEIYQLLEALPGVDYVTDVGLSSPDVAGAEDFRAPAEPLWHDSGDLIGLGLGSHLLPWARVDAARLFVGASFVPVRLSVRTPVAKGVDPAPLRRDAKAAARRLFHPGHGGPDGSAAQWIAENTIRQALEDAGLTVTHLEVTGGSGPRPQGPAGEPGVWIAEGDLVDLSVEVEVA